MYKGKASFGTEGSIGLRPKKAPKDSRGASGGHSHDHSRIQSTQGKNQLSKYKVKVNAKLLDYICLLESEVDATKKKIKQEQESFIGMVLNVTNFLGVQGVDEESILEYMNGLNLPEEEPISILKKPKNGDWFETLQQNRFKSFLYGSGGAEKKQPKPTYAPEPVQEKRKYRRAVDYPSEPKRRKKVESRRPARSQRKEKEISLNSQQGLMVEQEQPDYEQVQEDVKPNQTGKMMVEEEDDVEMDGVGAEEAEGSKYNYEGLEVKRQEDVADLVSKQGQGS